jgi:hypothetical protein
VDILQFQQQLLVVPAKCCMINSSAFARLAKLETLAWNLGPFAAPFPFSSAHTLKHKASDEESNTLLKWYLVSGNTVVKSVVSH